MKLDIKSLLPKTKLNDKIWAEEDNSLNPEVKKKLMVIALDFLDSLDLSLDDLEDIIITGSLANYNWSSYSDLDLHIMLDFSRLPERQEFIDKYFNAKKNLWNNLHDIKMHGHDVEIYVQDVDEPHFATGIYSIMKNKWLTIPTVEMKNIDKSVVINKTKDLIELIKYVESFLEESPIKAMELSDKLQEKLKTMRSCGLAKGGEYSVENLSFKLLRRTGFMDRIRDVEQQAYDKIMTVK